MNVLIVGNGGREHALAWKIKQSPKITRVFCAPGNPGTAQLGENVPIKVNETDRLVAFAQQEAIGLTVVGPEVPLVEGIVDAFNKAGLRIFGPEAGAARLEGSKVFAKNLMRKYHIPTAGYAEFTEQEKAVSYLNAYERFPVVLKADGLAAGKGVLICQNRAEALEGVRLIMADKAFGQAGNALVIEEFLDGEEISVFALCDGTDYLLLPSSQDHKKALEGDKGKNTGGMGAYAPAPSFTPDLRKRVEADIISRTLQAMQKEGLPYKGLLYFGLMVVGGEPYILEYNCRFGDPETEAVLPLVESDLVPLLEATIDGTIREQSIVLKDKAAMDVVLASGGYPDAYEKGKLITGLNDVPAEIIVFHAGTAPEGGQVVTAGGRVLNVVAIGDTLPEAKKAVYDAIENIHFEKMFYRRDIGFRAL